jgi:Protein of unknown function (DUF4038)/Putative collagen-binding domain of a collagenase
MNNKQTGFLLSVLILLVSHSIAQIRVSDNGRFLVTEDSKPFFWLGDTDWELFHRLTREEAKQFIDVRAEQGFNVLQAVALAEFNGIREPNRYGDYPLNNEDPTQLLITPGDNPANAYEYDYWDHVDYVIDYAASKGIYIGLLPTWGDKLAHMWGDGPIVFTEKNSEVYARTLATRYAQQKNILWILGGDRPAVYKWKIEGVEKNFDDRPLWRAMAKGIQDVLGEKAFITYHPAGGSYRTTNFLTDEPWLDMHAFQSGHGSREADAWNWVTEDLTVKPTKPTLDMEPCYEDHPVNPWDGKWTRQRGYFNAYDVRARIYRGVFAGACGVTYGHHQIWQFLNKDLYAPINIGDTIIGWQKAAYAEAATQMQHLKNLLLSRPYETRIADQSLIKSPLGTTYVDLVYATSDSEKTYALIYLPQNKPVKIDLSKISGSVKNVWWYDVSTGNATAAKSIKGNGVQLFTPPKEQRDWVLVIDDAAKKFDEPGKRNF